MSMNIYQLDTKRVIEQVLEAWGEELPSECLEQVAEAAEDTILQHIKTEITKLFI